MKKILLTAVNAKYIHSNLAVYSLRAYARELKENIVLAEYTINNRTEYILREIYLKKPDVICFSCYIWNISIILEVAEEFHKLCPKVPIWVGGGSVLKRASVYYWCHNRRRGENFLGALQVLCEGRRKFGGDEGHSPF